MKRHEPIPRSFPVKPLKAGQKAEDKATCGHCGLSWDDGKVTSMTPAPGARCPFEEFHVYADEPATVETELLAALEAATERMEAVAAGIPVHKRHKGVSPATHVAHMAGHLEQHAKIARAAIRKAKRSN